MKADDYMPLLCHRCGCELSPGVGDFYIVRIEAFADPTPPLIEDGDPLPPEAIDAEMTCLIEEMSNMSQQELMDQVHRRLTIHLCACCYKTWIENPAG